MPIPQDLYQAQLERTERARAAILTGKFQVFRTNPEQWTVRNGDKLPYVVSLKSSEGILAGPTWTCTCMDFQQRGPQVLCKHIEGVRLLEAEQTTVSFIKEKEEPMSEPPAPNGWVPEDRLSRILWELRQPLDMSRVKRRQAPGLGTVPYLEGYDVIDRANNIFGFAWSFDLIGEPVVVRWQKKVLTWNQKENRKVPTLDASGALLTEEVGLVYTTGKVTVELDGRPTCHADLGRCGFSGDTPEALDMALAGSVTDCLKRCFRQLGEQFGNSLYDKEIAQSAGLEQGRSAGTTASTTPTPIRKYGDGVKVNGNVPEQEAFDQFKQKTGKVPGSKDELRNWLAGQRPLAVPASVSA
jgi:hypothetical protein